jgi:hypothetical protein
VKVWIATSGEYDDYAIRHVFAHREDAEAYQLRDAVEEHELHDGPIVVRLWHTLTWNVNIRDREGDSNAAANPLERSYPEDYDGNPQAVTHRWTNSDQRPWEVDILTVEGWNLTQVRNVYAAERMQYLARDEWKTTASPMSATYENR